MRKWTLILVPLWLGIALPGFVGAADSAHPWNMEALSKTPQTYPAPEFTAAGMKALFYDGPAFKGQPTRVFAWYGAPAVDRKLPAMVLVHGGGGTAFSDWVKLWNERGYAAIAMDTCGCVPRGTYGNWERHAQGGPAGWGDFERVNEPPQDQWSYHAVADVVLAHSLIRSFPEVDAERIGVTGISWGGYLTCIVAGVDHRFKFAAPVYGCGFLGESSAWVEGFQKLGQEKARRWLELWDPSVYLTQAPMPMLWVTGTNDFAYPMDSLRKSYRLPEAPRQLCVRPRMPHAHGGPGEKPEEIHVFADSLFEGGVPLPRITSQGREGNRVWVTYVSETPITKAVLNFTKDTGVWKERNWEEASANIDASARTVSAALPEGTVVYYFNLFDNRDVAVSSEHEVMEK